MHDEELFSIASAVVSIYRSGVLVENRLFFKNREVLSKKSLSHALENVTNCPSALPLLPPGCLRKWNLAGKSARVDHVCTTAPLRSLVASRSVSLCCASRLILRVLQL